MDITHFKKIAKSKRNFKTEQIVHSGLNMVFGQTVYFERPPSHGDMMTRNYLHVNLDFNKNIKLHRFMRYAIAINIYRRKYIAKVLERCVIQVLSNIVLDY